MLKQLSLMLAEKLDEPLLQPKDIASIAKQYRETIAEIEEIEGVDDKDDEIGEILSERKADGKSGTVR